MRCPPPTRAAESRRRLLVALGLAALVLEACSDGAPAIDAAVDLLADSISTERSDWRRTDATGVERCEPSADLLKRIDPSRIKADLAFLTSLARSGGNQRKAADYLRTTLAKIPGLLVREHSYSYSGTSFVNLEATLPGGEAQDKYIVACAHYDSVSGSPGADDNASGTATVLEVARALIWCKPRRSIRLVFFSNEEISAGTIGSIEYVAWVKPTMPPANVVGVVNVDTVAYGPDTEDLDLVTKPAHKAFADATKVAIEQSTSLKVKEVVGEQPGMGDEGAFWSEGYTALLAIEEHTGGQPPVKNPNYHTAGDTLATLNPALHAQVTRAILAAVTSFANGL